mmetsp:Transcript_31751/g.53558  ORF Transcript_31751/g.53558 Transcript_31751/m.53558 type:complete len:266 (+) Transcript_31751:108-905(+)
MYQGQQQPTSHGGGAGVPQGMPDYFKNVSPEMINFGLNAGQDMLNKQRDKWMPGLSGFWLSLKYYFSVSNSYVLKKIVVILHPSSNKVWNRIQADEFEREGEGVYSRKWALPKQDYNAPDLYIPLMAFMTYVLLYGLGKGLGTTSEFSPDLIINAIWRCLILQLIESGLIKFGVNLMSVPVPFLDICSYTGYKYVALCINFLARIMGTTVSVLVSLATSAMLAYFMLKTMAAVVPPQTTVGPPRHLLLLGFAVMQVVVILTLSFM